MAIVDNVVKTGGAVEIGIGDKLDGTIAQQGHRTVLGIGHRTDRQHLAVSGNVRICVISQKGHLADQERGVFAAGNGLAQSHGHVVYCGNLDLRIGRSGAPVVVIDHVVKAGCSVVISVRHKLHRTIAQKSHRAVLRVTYAADTQGLAIGGDIRVGIVNQQSGR